MGDEVLRTQSDEEIKPFTEVVSALNIKVLGSFYLNIINMNVYINFLFS